MTTRAQAIACLAATLQQRRCSRPFAFELDPILRKIGPRLAQVAKGLYLRAEAEENRIAIKFDG